MNYMNMPRSFSPMAAAVQGQNGTASMPVSDAAQILQVLDQASFAVDDVLLYLDTHPNDTEALAYYQYVKSLRDQVMNAYTDQYGPLMKDQERSTTSWTWVNGPWPWEGGRN